MFNLFQSLAHITAKFILDDRKYEIEQFHISFSQQVDKKGQPQHEVNGGQLFIKLTQSADNNLYEWARKSTLSKNGSVLFQTDLGITILEIDFSNAYCINLVREINAMTGTFTSLVIAPEEISLNGVKHENFWTK